MYKKNFVVSIKNRGRILREHGDNVYLPFGSEYSILLKNLGGRKAVAKISVDGRDVLSNNEIIIGSNSELELKGFMKGMNVTNRFKFIKKTDEISKYRGDRIDDGLIKVEFRFEEVKRKQYVQVFSDVHYLWNNNSSNLKSSYPEYCSNNVQNCVGNIQTKCINDDGITVNGSPTNQNFVHGYTDVLEDQSSIVVIRLCGKSKIKSSKTGKIVTSKINKPITVKLKVTCPTCGKKWKTSMKYCGNCSTCLI